jgi:hypothetical protein
MSTPTPRTSSAIIASGFQAVPYGFQDFARNLEAELITLTAERDQLRSENYTLRAAQKACEACDEPTAFEVRQLRAELATEREKSERYRLASLKLDAQLAEWSVLNLWGGTPEIIHEFIKGQQSRIHHSQDIEAELAAERARLDAGQILLTVAGKRVWHCGVDLRAAIDAAMKEYAK